MSPDPFVVHRNLLFTIAYEILGSAADAEDVLQETWLRWDGVDQSAVNDPRAYLVRAVTRQALNRLRTQTRRREDYVGSWLPEPLLTSPDVAADVELAESVSLAMLTVLEALQPVERAVFVLREVFASPYEEIAEATGKSQAAVRQIAHRAREHVAAQRPRVSVTQEEHERVVEQFLASVQSGNVQDLLDVLAPDVVVVADGGGFVNAARRPIQGAARVARALVKALKSTPVDASTQWINGSVGAVLHLDGQVAGTLSFSVSDGRITRVYAVGNPHKLAHLQKAIELTRS